MVLCYVDNVLNKSLTDENFPFFSIYFRIQTRMKNSYDIIVIGAGHAGIEATVSSARMGMKVGLITMDLNAIGRLSCNPAIGGTAKGHLVKEIDALGGVMGILADRSGIQFKMLNRSKGPAIWSPRCQSDKEVYSKEATKLILSYENIELIQDMVKKLIVDDTNGDGVNKPKYIIKGVKTESGIYITCKSVIITTGTFLNAVMHTGRNQTLGGRIGEKSATGLSECLMKLGFKTGRLKTGTPPRLDINTIDFDKTVPAPGDEVLLPFSFRTKTGFPFLQQVDCHLTYTNHKTHEELRKGFSDSPMFSGRIKGTGPRYCPSIEDKVNRFSDKPRHQIFLEPETLNGNTIYMNGFSTSLPLEVQETAARTIPGLENVRIVKQGYAVEYDFFPTWQVNATMETKLIEHLYTAGQINGTSGYEEAAAQGLIAGINSVLKLRNQPPFILKRSEAYIGVLIDDLINKTPEEPYRMFTSNAEYRLVLRQDNADIRLMKYGNSLGLIEDEYIKILDGKLDLIKAGLDFAKANTLSPRQVNTYLNEIGSSDISSGEFISNLVRRNSVSLKEILHLADFTGQEKLREHLLSDENTLSQIEIELKYDGYIKRMHEQIKNFERNESINIPPDFNYDKIQSLSAEGREKLNSIRPTTLGQAMRISGVRTTDVSALMIFMRG